MLTYILGTWICLYDNYLPVDHIFLTFIRDSDRLFWLLWYYFINICGIWVTFSGRQSRDIRQVIQEK